jgi:integrase
MKTLKHPRYTFPKLGIYYFTRSVPDDLRHLYSRPRIVKSLRTKSRPEAKLAADALAAKLNDYWLGLRLTKADVPGQNLILDQAKTTSSLPTIEECLKQYLRVKGHNRPKTFFMGANRNIGYLVAHLGNRPLDDYNSADGSLLRDKLLSQGLGAASLQRVFGSVRAVVNFSIRENGLDCKNPFIGIYLPPEENKSSRQPIPLEDIHRLQKLCIEVNDDIRWLLALISDTGMRLAEATGLIQDDLHLDDDLPYVQVRDHAHRRLKTESSNRAIPLVGTSLWAAKRIADQGGIFCFPRYTNKSSCNSNSASAAANKWLKSEINKGSVIHGLRHSYRDRLRAIEAPTELIDQLGGWSKNTVGQNYGNGYSLDLLHSWAKRIATP